MGTPKEWKRLRTGDATDYTILRIREDLVSDPRTGAGRPRVIIEAPDWVNIIPVTIDEQVVLVRQFRFGIWSPALEIPGGMVDPGEDPLSAAVRELEEETGYTVERLEPLARFYPSPGFCTELLHVFLGLGLRVCTVAADEEEDLELVRLPLRKALELVRRGEIIDAKTVVGLLAYRDLTEYRSVARPSVGPA